MTVRDMAEVAGISPDTIKRKIRELYPEKMVKGKETRLTREEAISVMQSVRKTNMVEPMQNAHVPMQIAQLENMIKEMIQSIPKIVAETVKAIGVASNVKQLEIKQDYYSIQGYARMKGIQLTFTDAKRLGKEAKALSEGMRKEVRECPDERWGKVGSYSVEVLEKVFSL